MKSAVVVGAGMVGVSTALALLDRGWAVTLVDRKQPGRETSFGNAGIIQVEAVEPYAMPRSFSKLFEIATGRSNDVLYSLRDMPQHAASLLRYWWNSETGRHRKIAFSWANLIRQATVAHEPLIARAGADNLIRRGGWRVLYRTQKELDAGLADAERIRSTYDVPFIARNRAETAADEPVLTDSGVGSIHWVGSWTASNPGGLVEAYFDLYARSGGRFVEGDGKTLRRDGAGWMIDTVDGPLSAEHAVVCLGPWSNDLLMGFGHRFPMVRKRGYHAHYHSPMALSMPILDTERGYVMAPMTAGTRITTGAHLAGFDAPMATRQLERAEKAAAELFTLGGRVEDVPWYGTRPCMVDMLPVVGSSASNPGLWMNFGHGHQGFTLGPASGAMLAAMMDGDKPVVDPLPFRPDRF